MTQATMTSEAQRLRKLAMSTECIPCEDETYIDWSQRRRLVSIGRSVRGSAFVVTAPADFAESVAEVLRRPATVALNHDAIDGEHIGEDVSRQPFLY